MGNATFSMMYPRGENVPNPHDPEIVDMLQELGAESGQILLKHYTQEISIHLQKC